MRLEWVGVMEVELEVLAHGGDALGMRGFVSREDPRVAARATCHVHGIHTALLAHAAGVVV